MSMNKFYILPILSILFLITGVTAQQKSQQSLYLLNYGLINPAFTGIDNYGQVQAGLRRQWVGVDGAPSINWISGSFALNKDRLIETTSPNNYSRPSVMDHGHGLGFTLMQESIGPYSTANIDIAYAYHLPVAREAALSIGFSAGMQHTRYDVSKNIYPDQNLDPSVNAQAGSLSRWTPDLNAGILFYTRNFFAGTSLLQLIPAQYLNTPSNNTKTKTLWSATTGYSFDLDDSGTRLWLSTAVKTDFSNPVRYDLSAKLSFQQLLWAGIAYRKDDAMSMMAGINIHTSMFFAYMYDYSTSNRLDVYSKGSHELTIGYRFLRPNQNISPKISW